MTYDELIHLLEQKFIALQEENKRLKEVIKEAKI